MYRNRNRKAPSLEMDAEGGGGRDRPRAQVLFWGPFVWLADCSWGGAFLVHVRPAHTYPGLHSQPLPRTPPHPPPNPKHPVQEYLVDIREHDVPHHMRFCIDTDVRCGCWYTVRSQVSKG